ncbi:hypothetical protein ACVWZB_002845 [Paenibacillus polymyxa]|jgi:hypothetical protein|nr:hypothetical protein PPE_06450 [Paenibacillus polymyxa E681]MBP1173424.1 hypothetical protein [Paenibacillus sp. PvR133]
MEARFGGEGTAIRAFFVRLNMKDPEPTFTGKE